MVRSAASRVSNHEAVISLPAAILRDAREERAPQDEDFLLGAFFPSADFIFTADFVATSALVVAFLANTLAPLRVLGRLRSAARCAAAKDALAQAANSSESSNSRAGNCQYELTVTVLAVVLC